MAPSPIADTVEPSKRAVQEPGPPPELGSLASSRPLLAEPSWENETMMEDPSSVNLA